MPPEPDTAAAPPPDPLSFDLVDRPWIPVLLRDGTVTEFSLLEVFERAGEVRRIVGDLPTQEFVLIRLLLAILHDALDGPEDVDVWNDLWNDAARTGSLPLDRIRSYLDEHREGFDLLHPRRPFLQVAALRTSRDEVFSLDRIVADVPANERFFTMRALGTDRLSFAEAARWVLHTHGYDTSGIKTGIEGDPRTKGGRVYPHGTAWAGALGGVFVEGEQLRDTLLLNLIAVADLPGLTAERDDRPAWRHDDPGSGALSGAGARSAPAGLRDLYTWQSRRLRLHADTEGVYGVVLGYGDPLVARSMLRREPMTAWRRSSAQEKKLREPQVYLPREHHPSVHAWRGVGALTASDTPAMQQRQEAAATVQPRVLQWIAQLTRRDGDLDPGYFIRVRLLGVEYGTQQSVIDEVIDDSLTMAVALLASEDRGLAEAAVTAAGDAERAVFTLAALGGQLAEAAGRDEGPSRDAARERGFGALDVPYRQWLVTLTPGCDVEERLDAWHRDAAAVIRGIGDQLVEDAGEPAWTGRVQDSPKGPLWLCSSRSHHLFLISLRKQLARAHPATTPTEAVPS